jgi:hypothetical protein
MRPDDFRQLLRRQPFCPFRVFVSDGTTYDITHPENASVVHMSLRIGLRPGGIMDPPRVRFAFVSILHITRVEVFYPLGTTSPS